jgi:hypothetical protein
MPKGQMFVVKEGPRAMFISVTEVKDAPVTLAVAAPQIEQFLMNKKNKDLASAELTRLRAGAKIEYLNKSMAPDPNAAAPAANTSPVADNHKDKAALDRGVAGLK